MESGTHARVAHAGWLFSSVVEQQRAEILALRDATADAAEARAAEADERAALHSALTVAVEESAALREALQRAEAELRSWTRLAASLGAELEQEKEARVAAEQAAARAERVAMACAEASLRLAAAPALLVRDCAVLRRALALAGGEDEANDSPAESRETAAAPAAGVDAAKLRGLLARAGVDSATLYTAMSSATVLELRAGQLWRGSSQRLLLASGALAEMRPEPGGRARLRCVLVPDDEAVRVAPASSFVALLDTRIFLVPADVPLRLGEPRLLPARELACTLADFQIGGLAEALEESSALAGAAHAALLRAAAERAAPDDRSLAPGQTPQ